MITFSYFIDSYYKFTWAVKQSDIKRSLSQVYDLEMKYKQQNGYFTSNPNINLKNLDRRSYSIYIGNNTINLNERNYPLPIYLKSIVNHDSFIIIGVGNIDNDDKLDIWTIDEKKHLVNVSNDTPITPWDYIKKMLL
jgi:hypothetical protein